MDGVVHTRGNQEHRRKRIDQPYTDVPGKAISPAKECRRSRIAFGLVRGVRNLEILRQDAMRPWFVGDEVVRPTANQCQVSRPEFDRLTPAIEPQPRMTLNHRVNGQLDRAR